MTLKTDRRTQHRKRPLSLVYVELPPSNGGMMRDVSEYGFSLRAMMPLQQSEKIPFSFVLDSTARIDGEAIVVRLEDGGHVAALEFAGLSAHFRDQIRRWLDRFDETIAPEPAPPAESNASKHVSLTELRAKIRPLKSPPSSAQPEVAAPADRTPSPPPPSQTAEVAAAVNVVAPPAAEPPSASPIPVNVESARPQPPVVAASPITETTQPPAPTVMALPKPPLPPAQELPPPPPPPTHATVEEQESSSLPPLLKLSSVRPGPLPTEISEEPAPVEVSISATEPPASIPLSLPKAEPLVVTQPPVAEPPPVPPLIPRRAPPALEPLSSFESETDLDTPGWMDRFTLARAIGIMVVLTLLAGSYVYHRELGHALIWLGHQIAGDESPENSKIIQPQVPVAVRPVPEPKPEARTIESQSSATQHSTEAMGPTKEPTSANLPAASDKTPSPQLKGPSPGSLVPLTQVTRPPAPTPPADNPVEPGQPEYLQALQILRSPSRSSEVPAAVQLLWAAVEKGNTGAEIDLAELFRTGRGVTKNCDQTRVLLSAAARKGSAEARKRLESFQRQGCGN